MLTAPNLHSFSGKNFTAQTLLQSEGIRRYKKVSINYLFVLFTDIQNCFKDGALPESAL